METTDILKQMYKKLVKTFLDLIILSELRNRAMSGYDIIAFVHSRFRILISSGTVYPLLYSLERDGLIKGGWHQRRRVYTLTEKGEATIKAILNANDKIRYLMKTLLISEKT